MALIDPTTDIGKVRLRVADYSDLPYLPDAVYTSEITIAKGNLTKASKQCALYILGMLAHKVHRKMGLQLEVFGGEAFAQYKAFLLLTVKDPAFMNIDAFIPYGSTNAAYNPIVQFQKDWNRNYFSGTQSQKLAIDADISPNDGSRYGPYSSNLPGWTLA